MSSEPPQKNNVLSIVLTYNGSKATQHFTGHFPQTSLMLFRKDLETLRFSLPKMNNSKLKADTVVAAWWPDVSPTSHAVLYNSLKCCASNAVRDGLLAQLSISLLQVIEIGPAGSKILASVAVGDKPVTRASDLEPPMKRLRLQDGAPMSQQQQVMRPDAKAPLSMPPQQVPQSQHTNAPQNASSSSAAQGVQGTTSTALKRTWDGQIVPSAHSSSTAPRLPSAALVHGLPPRPQGPPLPPIEAIRSNAAQSVQAMQNSRPAAASRVASNAQAGRAERVRSQSATQGPSAPQPAQSAPPVASGSVPHGWGAKATAATAPAAPPRPPQASSSGNAPRGGSASGAPAEVEQKNVGYVTMSGKLYAMVEKDQHAAETSELETYRKGMGSKDTREMLTAYLNIKAYLDQTSIKLLDEQRARRDLQATVGAAQAREAEAKRRVEELQKQLDDVVRKEEGAREAMHVGDADAKRRLDETQKLLADEKRRRSEADALRWAATTMCSEARRERDDFAQRFQEAEKALGEARAKSESLQERLDQNLLRVTTAENDAAAVKRTLEATAEELELAKKKLHEMQMHLTEEKELVKSNHGRLAVSERNEATLRRQLDETKQLLVASTSDADAVRATKARDDEALRVLEDQTRWQRSELQRAQAAAHAAQTAEDALRSRLDEVERALDAERRRRREAEDAVADIRRECREPFVVPSLLDAFVELAKMTTAATTVSEEGELPLALPSMSAGGISHTQRSGSTPVYRPLTPPPNASHSPNTQMSESP